MQGYLIFTARYYFTVYFFSSQLSDNAVYGVSCIFRQLLTSFSRTYFTSLNDKIAQDVVKVLVNLFEISSQRSVALEVSIMTF